MSPTLRDDIDPQAPYVCGDSCIGPKIGFDFGKHGAADKKC
jgi:hypothetical protein